VGHKKHPRRLFATAFWVFLGLSLRTQILGNVKNKKQNKKIQKENIQEIFATDNILDFYLSLHSLVPE